MLRNLPSKKTVKALEMTKLTPPSLAALTLAFALPAGASSIFTGLHSFGDSLTDSGNVFAASGGTQPDNPLGLGGRWGNGPTWAEKLNNDYLGLPPLTPSNLGGTNHAWGGALTDGGGLVPSVVGQINSFTTGGGSFSSSDLVTIWAGPNDAFQGVTDPSISVGHLGNAMSLVSSAGAEHVLVLNLPDLGKTPTVQALGEPFVTGLTTFTSSFNALLAAEVATQATTLGINITLLDVDGIYENILADPGRFGFTNVDEPVLLTGDLASADESLYWDGVHPTDAVHEIIAAEAALALGIPEPSSTLLVLSASFLLTARHRRSRVR